MAAGALAAAALLLPTAPAAAADLGPWRDIPPRATWGPERGVTDVEPTSATEAWTSGYQGRLSVRGPQPPNPPDGGPPPPRALHTLVKPKPMLQRWTGGTGWTSHSPPGLPGEGIINAIDSSAPDHVWFCGHLWNSGHIDAYAARWDGAELTRIAIPLAGSCTDVLVHGQHAFLYEQGRVHHRRPNGTWASFDADKPAFALAGPEPGVYLQADGKLRKWDGSGFAALPAALTDGLHLATREHGFWSFRPDAPYRWDGTAWQAVAKPADYTPPYMHSSTSNYYTDADGPWFATVPPHPAGPDQSSVYHWNGTDWDRFEPGSVGPYYAQLPTDLHADDSGRVWAVTAQGRSYLEGTTWTQLPDATGLLHFHTLPGGQVLAYGDGQGLASTEADQTITVKTTAPLP